MESLRRTTGFLKVGSCLWPFLLRQLQSTGLTLFLEFRRGTSVILGWWFCTLPAALASIGKSLKPRNGILKLSRCFWCTARAGNHCLMQSVCNPFESRIAVHAASMLPVCMGIIQEPVKYRFWFKRSGVHLEILYV